MTDFRLVLVSIGGLLLILFALDLIIKLVNGTAPSESLSNWWEKSGENQEQNAYKKKRQRREKMTDRYDQEKSFTGPMKKGKGFYDN